MNGVIFTLNIIVFLLWLQLLSDSLKILMHSLSKAFLLLNFFLFMCAFSTTFALYNWLLLYALHWSLKLISY